LNLDDQELAKERTELASLRTQLAAERTFASWIRTSLAAIGGGFVFARLIQFETAFHQQAAIYIGILLVCWGIAISLYAAVDYYRMVKALNIVQTWPTHPMRFLWLCLALILLAVGVLVILL
jgi:putative membrane protein